MSGNFFPAPEVIVRELGPGPAVFYGRVWRYCQGGGTCFASLATLATECGVSVSTVQRWTRELSDAGYIVHESGRMAGGAGSITTTRKWIMGGEGQNDQGVGRIDRVGMSKRTTGVGQNDLLLKESEEKKEDTSVIPSLRSGATGHDTATAAALPPKRKATRNPKPLFDAFKAAFPTAKASKAGEFDSECSKVGLSIEDWHAFMASTKAKQDYLDGYLTMGNALNRFNAWAVAVGRRSNPASRDDTPAGAPANWRDIVYTHDGTRRYPALALPRLGLEPYAPPSEWPTWYQLFEGVQS